MTQRASSRDPSVEGHAAHGISWRCPRRGGPGRSCRCGAPRPRHGVVDHRGVQDVPTHRDHAFVTAHGREGAGDRVAEHAPGVPQRTERRAPRGNRFSAPSSSRTSSPLGKTWWVDTVSLGKRSRSTSDDAPPRPGQPGRHRGYRRRGRRRRRRRSCCRSAWSWHDSGGRTWKARGSDVEDPVHPPLRCVQPPVGSPRRLRPAAEERGPGRSRPRPPARPDPGRSDTCSAASRAEPARRAWSPRAARTWARARCTRPVRPRQSSPAARISSHRAR